MGYAHKTKRTDFYLKHPAKQPKLEIARYAQSCGILVPQIFESYEDAMRSGKDIIARSEHPQEYDGISGLLRSPVLSKDNEAFVGKGYDDFKTKMMEIGEYNIIPHRITDICRYLNLDRDAFELEVSFSFWEYLSGVDQIVVADSSIEGRYHIMSCDSNLEFSKKYYTIIDDGIVHEYLTSYLNKLTSELRNGLDGLIKTYERIRNLENFDANHCPIMEFKTVGNKNYFLQYHRTRDFSPATFILDREPIEGEIKAPFVRGVTTPEGVICKTRVFASGPMLRETEEGAIYIPFGNLIYPEVMVRKRILTFFPFGSNQKLEKILSDLAYGHGSRSQIFKPQISIIAELGQLVNDNEWNDAFIKAMEEKELPVIDFFVISDGRQAFFKRV
ncbi:MAG: hypothetical protein WC501_00605 [Candidatus Micrarchaeia archaeon]